MIYFENIIQNHYSISMSEITINPWSWLILPVFRFQKPYVIMKNSFYLIYFTENISFWHMELTSMFHYTCLDNQMSLWSSLS